MPIESHSNTVYDGHSMNGELKFHLNFYLMNRIDMHIALAIEIPIPILKNTDVFASWKMLSELPSSFIRY